MATFFGEIVPEFSSAGPEDEEEDSCILGLQSEIVFEDQVGDSLKNSLLCLFYGKVANGFAEGIVKNLNDQWKLLRSIHLTGETEATVDSLMAREKKRKIIAQLYLKTSGSGPKTIFGIVNTFYLPRYFANTIIKEMESYITSASNVVIFHSELEPKIYSSADMYGEGNSHISNGKIFYIKTDVLPSSEVHSLKDVKALPQPYMILGFSAAVINFCAMVDKRAIALISYSETEMIDSISLSGYFHLIKRAKEEKNGIFSVLSNGFTGLSHDLGKSSKLNIRLVTASSNLYT